jgi:hypothetical protein
MITDTSFTDESGQSVTHRIATFLRQDGLAGALPTGWPTNPPKPARFDDAARTSGAPKTPLRAIVDEVATTVGGPLCLGIVDLDAARDPVTGLYDFAGWNLDVQHTIGSCAKVLAMYAAFQLRDDVRALIRSTPGLHQANLADKLKDAWRAATTSALQKVGRQGRMPRLAQIFDLGALPVDAAAAAAAPATDPAAIDFAGFANCGVPADFASTSAAIAAAQGSPITALASELETFHQHEYGSGRAVEKDMWEKLAQMPFGHRLWLTTAWSDNAAATTCATDVGFDYIDALMSASGLYNPARNIGARLSMTYKDSSDAIDRGTWRHGTPQFDRVSQFTGQSQGNSPHQAATARTLLCFIAALDARELISAADSEQMLALMRPLRWATGERGAGVPAFGLDGNPMLQDDGSSEHVDGVDSFILGAFDDFVDDPSIDLRVTSSWRPFVDAAGKIGIVGTTLADLALVIIKDTSGTLALHWGIAFTNDNGHSSDEFWKPASNQYGRALAAIVRKWRSPPP